VALRIDHIGSTSIPGLAAKDIIDIQVTVAELDEGLIRPMIVGAGFEWLEGYRDHEPPGMSLDAAELEKLFARAPANQRRANIHIRAAGRFNQRYPLLFRDYCREHPLVAAAYGEVKRALTRLVDGDVDAYYDIKDPVIDILMSGANEWAAATGWEPEPPQPSRSRPSRP
jgi:GrpB-like predicted nucleotidyltransferase (UPF0157 family)